MTPAIQHPPEQIDAVVGSTTRRDRVVSALLALFNVPVFGFVMFCAWIWGPEQFFGEYSNAAGREAVVGLVLILVAAASWAFFFASYSRAGGVNALGFLVVGAAAATDVLILVPKVQSLAAHQPDRGLPDSDPLPWQSYAGLGAWAIVAVFSALAMRHPRIRWISVVPIAVIGVGGLVLLADKLAAGMTSMWILAVAAPLVVSLLLLAALFPHRTRAEYGAPPR